MITSILDLSPANNTFLGEP